MKFDIHYLLLAKYAKWIIISLICLFSTLILFEYATLFFLPGKGSALAVSNQKILVQKKQDSLSYLLNSALFGVYVPGDLNEDNVKKSILNVSIVGIMLGDKADDSQVIIRTDNGEEKTYRVGDKIPGGALVKRIMAEGILVERDGTLESLCLPKIELHFEPVAKPLKGE